jgi:hypothetical protein
LDRWLADYRRAARTDPGRTGRLKPRVTPLDGGLLIQRTDFAARVDFAAGRGVCVVAPGMVRLAVETFLRILYAGLAAQQGGLLLHAAGVVRGGAAAVFPGVSGTGKSTIASLAPPDASVLSDEMVLVRPVAGRFEAFGTPFFGTGGWPGLRPGAPLRAVYLPVKAGTVGVDPVRPALALRGLLAAVLSFDPDPVRNQALLDAAARLVAEVPCRTLRFRRDATFWAVIDAGLDGSVSTPDGRNVESGGSISANSSEPNKARLNRRKHGVTFEQAATVFRDARAVSVFDDTHSSIRGMTS